MALSGTYAFNLDIDAVIQEATEMIGGGEILGHEPASARRSLNLLITDWQNQGILLWSTDVSTINVAVSTTTYDLSSATIDVMEAVLNRDNTDIQMTRISFEEYLKIPTKGQTGRPSQYTVKRNQSYPTMYVWPLPENSTDVIKVERIGFLQDINKSANQNADVPRRFLPCLTTGLAYYMSMKRPGVDPNRIAMLKAVYGEQFKNAMEEDKERASLYFKPKLGYV